MRRIHDENRSTMRTAYRKGYGVVTLTDCTEAA
jgi:nicotinamidase-related amidase